MRRLVLGAMVFAAWALLGPASASAQVRAGAAAVDASWHVGASAGQYASDCVTDPAGFTDGHCSFVDHADGTFDPTAHSVRRGLSYGMQSRLSARAIVIEGADGQRIAIVKNDLYIPQDLLWRRTAQLLEQGDSGIGHTNLTMVSTHDHSSPFYSSTSWGVWAFQDVFDVRFYEYYAERMAEAVEQAAAGLVPVRVGASVSQFDKTHRHSFGPAIADDGTPAGYPKGNQDHDMTVIRFDDVSNPANPKPLANLVNFSVHPEFLEGNDLISADYVAPLQRISDRETGAVTIWNQGSVGTSEPERSEWHSVHERLEFSHRDYAQAERGARLMADTLVDTWRDIGSATPEDPGRFIPFMTDFPVQMADKWYPGPFSHPYPGVSNCRVDKGLAGNPQLPIVGLPDCEGLAGGLNTVGDAIGAPDAPDVPIPAGDPGLSTDDFEQLGIPVPENYSAPSYTGLEEDIDVHLQAFRLGDILFTVCSCEQWFDQSNNIETRTDKVASNEHLGFDWGAQCTDNGNGTWTCPNPNNPSSSLPPVTDHEYARMRAQVNNPANGWNDVANAPSAESEPTDTTQIKGNYTHDDTAANAALGYKLTVPISMGNDYNGYIATYREYQRGDHYRKALTGWGPHSSDYMASRLVTMGRRLKDPNHALPTDQQQEQLLAAKAILDTAVNDQRAAALGTVGGGAIAAYEAALPDDGGDAEAVEQPADTERFDASFFTWNGGSNFSDNPTVVVQRKVGAEWRDYAQQSGQIPVTLQFPTAPDGVAPYLLGDQEWHWTAHFEAFASDIETAEGTRATPAGTYRFVVDGKRRSGGAAQPYHLQSEEFEVEPWSGITVEDLQLEPDKTVSFKVGPTHEFAVDDGGPPLTTEVGPIDYPDSYQSPARFIREQRTAKRDPDAPNDPTKVEWFCFTCSFRPWADAGDAATAEVTIVEADGSTRTVAATEQGGRWRTSTPLQRGQLGFVDVGGVKDAFGNINGVATAAVSGGDPEPGTCANPKTGTEGPDTIVGTNGGDLIAALGGNDMVRGLDGDDCLMGDDGHDTLRGDAGADLLLGGRNRDNLVGGSGIDLVRGNRGHDTIDAVDGNREDVHCGRSTDVARVDRRDRVIDCERVTRVG